jgi:hypothetical protein
MVLQVCLFIPVFISALADGAAPEILAYIPGLHKMQAETVEAPATDKTKPTSSEPDVILMETAMP